LEKTHVLLLSSKVEGRSIPPGGIKKQNTSHIGNEIKTFAIVHRLALAHREATGSGLRKGSAAQVDTRVVRSGDVKPSRHTSRRYGGALSSASMMYSAIAIVFRHIALGNKQMAEAAPD
jgi:hypothetical protein